MPNPSASPSFTQEDTFMPNMPEPIQLIPTFTQTAFSQPAVHTQHTHPAQTNPTEKEKYEIWAMKMEYWIQNADHNLWRIVQQGNSPKRLGKDAKGNTIVHPPVSLDEHVAVQRENKVRTLLLQALPEDHMPDFHHYDDARDIWMAVKARFQRFWSQLNQVQARTDNDDINLEVSKALPSSWSPLGIGHCYSVKVLLLPLILPSLEMPALAQILFYDQLGMIVPSVFSDIWSLITLTQIGDGRNGHKVANGLLSLRITGLRMKAGRKDGTTTMQQLPDLTEGRLAATKCHRSLRQNEPKALVTVDSMVNWSVQCAENKTGGVEKAQNEKKEWEVKYEATLARFDKWKESSKNLKKLINSSTSTRTKIGLGFQEYFGVDEVLIPQSDIRITQVSYGSKVVTKLDDTISDSNDFGSCDISDKSSDSETYASVISSLRPRPKTSPAVDIQTLPESDVEDPNSTTGSPSFSCSENVKSPRIICNKSGMNNRNVCNNNFVRVKKCFVCGIRQHLVTADGADPASLVENRPAVNSADRPNPAGWSKRPATVSAGRPVSAGWLNPAARPYFRP
ncbi:hypothetical protein Tco_0953348 [Tanacetum coccineum]|uniref:Uncharacterized protein n=1 Tax=Tanacetum coccineum TaxID=301880 RepID=A0ABQ5E000_9ASTR